MTFLVGNPRQHHAQPQLSDGGSETGADLWRYRYAFVGPFGARIELKALHDNPILTVNRTYYQLGRITIENFYSVGTCLRDILAVKLLQRGYLPLCGAAFGTAEDAILILGLPGVGKSLVLLEAIGRGFRYLADELVVAGPGAYLHASGDVSSLVYELDRLASSSYYHRQRFWKADIFNFLFSKTPLTSFVFSPPYIGISSLYPGVEFVARAKIRAIFILSKGTSQIRQLSLDEASRMLVYLNRFQFGYSENRMLLRYSLANPWLNLAELRDKEEEGLARLAAQSSTYVCSAPEAKEYFKLIQQAL